MGMERGARRSQIESSLPTLVLRVHFTEVRPRQDRSARVYISTSSLVDAQKCERTRKSAHEGLARTQKTQHHRCGVVSSRTTRARFRLIAASVLSAPGALSAPGLTKSRSHGVASATGEREPNPGGDGTETTAPLFALPTLPIAPAFPFARGDAGAVWVAAGRAPCPR